MQLKSSVEVMAATCETSRFDDVRTIRNKVSNTCEKHIEQGKVVVFLARVERAASINESNSDHFDQGALTDQADQRAPVSHTSLGVHIIHWLTQIITLRAGMVLESFYHSPCPVAASTQAPS